MVANVLGITCNHTASNVQLKLYSKYWNCWVIDRLYNGNIDIKERSQSKLISWRMEQCVMLDRCVLFKNIPIWYIFKKMDQASTEESRCQFICQALFSDETDTLCNLQSCRILIILSFRNLYPSRCRTLYRGQLCEDFTLVVAISVIGFMLAIFAMIAGVTYMNVQNGKRISSR